MNSDGYFSHIMIYVLIHNLMKDKRIYCSSYDFVGCISFEEKNQHSDYSRLWIIFDYYW